MWSTTFNIDYHVEVDHHWYSVPYQLVHVKVEARVTATTVEVFLAGPAIPHENLRGAAYDEEAYADPPDDREAARATPDGDGHGV